MGSRVQIFFVNIPAGKTVAFKNHPSRAPVVWLVTGDVMVNGSLNLSGQNGVEVPFLAEPGPGGFRGGPGYYHSSVRSSGGLGPGGGGAIAILSSGTLRVNGSIVANGGARSQHEPRWRWKWWGN